VNIISEIKNKVILFCLKVFQLPLAKNFATRASAT